MMRWSEASEIARDNPGSVVRRTGDGSFTVVGVEDKEIETNSQDDLSKAKRTIADLEDKLKSYSEKLSQAENQLDRVRDEDWERIKIREKKEHEEHRKKLLEERRIVECSCLGTNENCHYCGGKGFYNTDGYGNRK